MPWTSHTLYWMTRLINILDYVVKAGCNEVSFNGYRFGAVKREKREGIAGCTNLGHPVD